MVPPAVQEHDTERPPSSEHWKCILPPSGQPAAHAVVPGPGGVSGGEQSNAI